MNRPPPYSHIKMASWLDERVDMDPDKRLLAQWVKYLEGELERSQDYRRWEYEREVFDAMYEAATSITEDLVAMLTAANHMGHTYRLHHQKE